MGTGVEKTHVAVAGPRLAECGTNGAGSPSTSRPCNPTFAQINREGQTQSGREQARQSSGWHPGAPHSHTDKPRGPDSEWQRMGQAEQRVADPTAPHSRIDKPDEWR